MIAIVIVAIGILATMSMLATDMSTNKTSERRIDASAIAQSILQDAISRASSAGYTSVTLTSIDPAPGGKIFYEPLTRFGGNRADNEATAAITVTPSPTVLASVSGVATHIRVVLTWQERGKQKQVELRGQAVTQ